MMATAGSDAARRKWTYARRILAVLLETTVLISLTCVAGAQTPNQRLRSFPPLFNAAENRPVGTEPSLSTCGSPDRVAYCKSSTVAESLLRCVQDFCVQTCPVPRLALPRHLNLLGGTSTGRRTCVEVDTINIRPGSTGEVSTFFSQYGPDCFETPKFTPSVGLSGSFTLTVWIWQKESNIGTIFEKVGNDDLVILRLEIKQSQVAFFYKSLTSLSGVVLEDTIPARIWTHLTIQVYDRTLSFYLDGLKTGFSAVLTRTLGSAVQDKGGRVRIGQTFKGTAQFLGRLQDFRFYDNTLSNREIEEVYSGSFPSMRIQTSCRCPASHPRVRPTQTHYCIRNGEPDNTGDTVFRVNEDAHPVEYVNDGDSNSVWISSFQDKVNLTVDLGDVFQVFYVVLQFYSPLPKAVLLEKQLEDSGPWLTWQMYADDCTSRYGQANNGPLPSPTAVNCLQFGIPSLPVPSSKGNITFNALSPEPVPRPGYNDFYHTEDLYDFVEASKVRVTLEDHFNVTEFRHTYYGLYEYTISARCQCNGHAPNCDTSAMPYICNCTVDSHTEGNKCDRCEPLHNDKPFQRGDPMFAYPCKPCQCYNHAESCVYDRTKDPFPTDHERGGGGVCVNCQHNTTGRNCETCDTIFYRPVGKSLYEPDVCQPCDCHASGVVNDNLDCNKVGGGCSCKGLVQGRRCDSCRDGYYNLQSSILQGCSQCECEMAGTVQRDITCHPFTGQCNCKANVRNRQCNVCNFGFFNLNVSNSEGCEECNCNPRGSSSPFCDPSGGLCPCQSNVVGRQCDTCAAGYYDFEVGCRVCQCNLAGTEPGTTCDPTTSQCVCKVNVQGTKCDQCKDGAYSFGSSSQDGCSSCNCDVAGIVANASICDKTSGICECKTNVVGRSCNQCRGNTWGLNVTDPEGCQSCGCDPSGTQRGDQVPANELTCNQNSGQCTCVANRVGRICDDCSSGFYVSPIESGGCLACQCHPEGSLPGTVCDTLTGQCQCRETDSGVTGLSCSACFQTFYNFDDKMGRCSACGCLPAGSVNDTCNHVTGQCQCKQFVQDIRCDRCVTGASILDANNPFGCSKAPAQQPTPEHVPVSSTEIQLTWQPPDYPNGIIQKYNLYRNGTRVADISPIISETRVSYNDSGLIPFTAYVYIVEAVNDFGTALSEAVTFRTPAGTPSGTLLLQVSNKGHSSARFSWEEPSNPNGPIEKYILSSRTLSQPDVDNVHWEGLGTSQTLTDLVPFTNYIFTLQVCTSGGCLSSEPVRFTTLSSVPGGQDPPTITAISSTELHIQWQPPRQPNGIISFYELWMRGPAGDDGNRNPPATRIFYPSGQFNPRPALVVEGQENALAPPATNYTASGLDPFTVYEFQVLSQNDAGKTASIWVAARTAEAAPLSMPAPVVVALSSTLVNITWVMPSPEQARGTVLHYTVYQFKPTDLNIDPFAPLFTWQMNRQVDRAVTSHVVSGLFPYTEYQFRVEMCNSVGCVTSPQSTGRTLPAAPGGVRKPLLEGYNSTTMIISWLPPSSHNGPAPSYIVERTSMALNYPPRVIKGTRFPGKGYYRFPPETVPQNVAFTGIELWFMTRAKEGVLLFSASEGQQEEFILIQFLAGRPRFVFDPQDCVQVIELDLGQDKNHTYNDGQWHKLTARRSGSQGKLDIDNQFSGCPSVAQPTNDEGLPYHDGKWHHLLARRYERSGSIFIDEKFTGKATSLCDHGNIIGTNTGVYIGGIPPDFPIRRNFGDPDHRARLANGGYIGCVKDIKILKQMSPVEVWEPLDWEMAEVNEKAFPNWEGCPVNLRPGYHFMGKGYAVLSADIFTGGDDFSFSLTFRTEMNNGLLFFSHGGRGIYVLAELRDGSVHFEFSNRLLKQSLVFPSALNTNFCDGQWRHVTFDKQGEMANITVRDRGSQLEGNAGTMMELSTVSPFFIGGIPSGSEAATFIRDNGLSVTPGFGGCISDLAVDGSLLRDFIGTVKEVLNVNLDGCPESEKPAQTCQSGLVSEVYRGMANITMDTELQPYTKYLYRLTAENSAGSTSSDWTNCRTREAAPEVVSAPVQVDSPTGYTIQVTWSDPTNMVGLLTQFILRAYNQDDTEETVVEGNITDVNAVTGLIQGVIPYTTYNVKLVACTSGGCTESRNGVTVRTREEAPELIPAPTAEAGSSYLLVEWEPPACPNGVITGYFLFRDETDDIQIYAGGERSFNYTGLQVYTAYRMYVRACTIQGCAFGPTAALSTAQLPPSFVKPPVLQSLGTSRVAAKWEEPAQLNGVLEGYQLFASVKVDQTGEMVYNQTDLFLTYTLTDLLAGTTYYIRVGACTVGGCRVSEPSSVTTEESSPEGVPDPVVISRSATQLSITWDVPRFPNGIITRYELYQNELKVFDTPNRREYQVDNLLPYSLHFFRVAACTSKGCGISDQVQGRTQEAPPSGFVNIDQLQVLDARTVQLRWTSPETPNGVLYYDVYFTGSFYVNPESWDYDVVQERRSLLRSNVSETAVDIAGLLPYSTYTVQVNASNTKGFLLSNIRQAIMPQGSPDGVKPPDLQSRSPTSITAVWQQVGRDNADVQPSFILQFRETTPGAVTQNVLGPTMSTTHTKDGLQPFTEYELRLVARNPHGDTVSSWTSMYTKQAAPTLLDPPRIVLIQAHYIDLQWNAPLRPNGILTDYHIYQNDVLRESVPANQTSLRTDNLNANSFYEFILSACTVAGCIRSGKSSRVQTSQAAPYDVPAPFLTSPSPTSVQITWTDPARPNGIIRQFRIERRLKGDNLITRVTTLSVTSAKVYRDNSAELSPFTTYEYRVLAMNDVGIGQGPWAEITTASSRPGGMQAPVVAVLGPRSIQVTWEAPIQPNGVLEYYSLRVPPSRKEIRNISQLVDVVENLTPYTVYSVSIAACTTGGCTESPAITVRTEGTTPEGQLPPTPTPVSQNIITLVWQPPSHPNGADLRYELARQKLLQPLDSEATDFGLWETLYSGNQTYHEDRGLTIFTTYQYRVTVFNGFGHMLSGPSTEVSTFGGIPEKAPDVFVQSLDYASLQVNWTTPSVEERKGAVVGFVLLSRSTAGNQTKTYGPMIESTVLTDLQPNTQYSITVTMAINGGATITSPIITATTMDGAPEGLGSPQLIVVSDSSLQVVWTEPTKPNGDITGYNIYIDDRRIQTNLTTAGSHIITDLLPYAVYSIQMEVCSVHDCVRSEVVRGTTAEAPPQGLTPPRAVTQGPHTVGVSWTVPSDPNGIILQYYLVRRTIQPCSQIPKPVISAEAKKCTYIECGRLESFCGTTCYSGPKTCCEGVLHDSQPEYECCGQSYVPRRTEPDAVCCGGEFHSRRDNYQCCGSRYISVLAGQVCCVDVVQDRVSVGYGDSCCNTIPYSSTGAQICCAGRLESGFGGQCCGGQMASDTVTCCGGVARGQAYVTHQRRQCCGSQYLDPDVTLCCASDTGDTKIHTYSNSSMKLAANVKCCGLETVSVGLSCCNYVGYNPISHICADRSDLKFGCGTGRVCPVIQSDGALCNRCDFDRQKSVCGSAQGYHKLEEETVPAVENQSGDCVTDESMIYTGLEQAYTDAGLVPYSRYEYLFRVVNSAGSSTSDITPVITSQSTPEGVMPPDTRVYPDRLYIIYLSWSLPATPNGEISQYILKRGGIELYRGLERQYVDDNTILPYTSYTYVLSACTVAGCTDSPAVSVATAEASPEDVKPPVISVVSSTDIQIEWSPPGIPNGIITKYSILMSNKGAVFNSTDNFQFLLRDLTPYTSYTFWLRVCTEAGCTDSSNVTAVTEAASPLGVGAPRFVVVSPTIVELYWSEPMSKNGEISAYRLYRSPAVDLSDSTLAYSGDPSTFFTRQTTLIAGTRYLYILEVVNGGGATNSTATVIDMPVTTPLNIPPPKNVTVLSATAIFASWDAPLGVIGTIDQYRILLNGGSEHQIDKGVGMALETEVDNLDPYTVYAVRIRACLQGVANGCGTGPDLTVRTFEAPPTGQSVPIMVAIGPDMVDISWEPPARPNGVIRFYLIHQRATGTTVEILINQVDNATLRFRHAGSDLQPYSEYEYRVTVSNNAGQTASPWARVRTLESSPVGMLEPVVAVAGAFGVRVSWQEPRNINGLIRTYDIEYKTQANDPTVQNPVKSVTVGGNLRATSISGLEPFTSYEVRVIARNTAGNAASVWVPIKTGEASPSGLGIFDVEKLTNGEAVILRWQSPSQPNGIITTYRIYENGNAVAVYQGLNREFEFRRLQPYTTYSVRLEACTTAGCTQSPTLQFQTAEIPPVAQQSPTFEASNATHVVLSWSKPVNPNGRILSYEVFRRTNVQRRKRDLSDPIVVYKSTDTNPNEYKFADSGLRPNTEYQYKIRATNSMGHSDSPWQSVTTEEAAPDGVLPPVVQFVSGDVYSLQITWAVPQSTNGIIQRYLLHRNDSSPPWSFTPADPMEYTDRGLNAYTLYSYTITACTAGGCSTSLPTSLRTKETAPLLTSPPSLTAVNSTAIKAIWQEPQIANGEITAYQLKRDGSIEHSGLGMEYTTGGLIPFQEYEFQLTACTNGGCMDSAVVTGRPEAAEPTDMAQPMVRVMSASSIEISWQAPRNPNGIVVSYDVRRDGNLVYTESLSIAGILLTTYTDYNLEPGTEYSYVVTATNSKGSVDTPPAKARTYSSSPSGIQPPVLVPQSPFSIQVTWQAPENPNGDLQNYTIYQGNEIKYSGSIDRLTYVVPGLRPWTEYTFRIQACTNRGCELSAGETTRTLEIGPQNQGSPTLVALADFTGTHNGVRVTWTPPANPNGEITHYVVSRQSVVRTDTGSQQGEAQVVFNGTQLECLDNDPLVKPYSYYRYSVTAVNKMGSTTSIWVEVLTKEAPPQGVPPPEILESRTTSTTITAKVTIPTLPNGVIIEYNIRVNGTVRSKGTGNALVQTAGQTNPLQPYSTYLVQTEACTRPGCTLSDAVVTMTTEAKPTGLDPIRVVTSGPNEVQLSWSRPSYPNGIITKYLVYQRMSCPPTDQPFPQPSCLMGEPEQRYSGLDLRSTVDNLSPYTTYDFQVQAKNVAGVGDFPVWVSTQTLPSDPQYVTFPRLSKNGTMAVVDWSASFSLNGKLKHYILSADGGQVFQGIDAIHGVERDRRDDTITFKITAITETGTAVSLDVVFDPNAVDYIGTTAAPSPSRGAAAPVYQEVWFIVLMCLIALLLLFLVLAFCIRQMTRPRPYIRERLPLESRQRKVAKSFDRTLNPYEGSVMAADFPIRTVGEAHAANGDILGPGLGVINPAYSNPSLHRYTLGSEHLGLTFDDISKSSKSDDEFSWAEQHQDSGLYDDDLDSLSAPSYSITKEQTIFTDTHL